MTPPADTPASIATRRLRNQRITSGGLRRAADVVSWLGAVQAQEDEPAKWALSAFACATAPLKWMSTAK